MARSSSGSSSTLAGVCVPVYDLAPGRILRAVEHASSLANEYADDAGEFYSMAMAELLVAAEVPQEQLLFYRYLNLRRIKELIFHSWRQVR
jgi:hypothetical protein